MARRLDAYMKFIKNNFIDIIAFIGVLFISIGFFILNIIAGFIATGLMLVGVAFLMSEGGD